MAADRPAVGGLTFQPVVDGAVLPRSALDAVRDGSAAGVRLVAGTTADEWNLFHLQARLSGTAGRRPAPPAPGPPRR